MAVTLNPYVNLVDGRARAALEFYRSVLGGELEVMTFGEMGTEGPLAEQVMHGQLSSDRLTLMVSDTPPEMAEVTIGNNVSISLSGGVEDEDWLRAAFDGLAQDGTVTVPLSRAPWGDTYGALVDQFGVSWMVDFGNGGAASGAADA